ncbi:MAG: hypothetical protein B7Z78_13800 [Rhodospirillales bacterium 20-60-12]|nr:MAG: hypothetical protein B7Z78_13800 [Rhodospirillales bacterium 20-60-12]
MLVLKFTGTQTIIERLGAVSTKVHAKARAALDVWAAELAGYIRAEKLSGQALNRRSGLLSGSVHPLADDSPRGIVGGAGGGAGVPYARIHEFGGTIPAHEVVARKAKALAFTVDGMELFAKRVQIPDVEMPERSYMRSAFVEKSPQGLADLRAAVKEAIL